MRLHNPAITGSLTVSGSLNVDFTSATGGVSGSFRPSDIKAALPADTVSGSAQLPTDIVSGSGQLATNISGSFTDASSSFSTRVSNLKSDSGSFSTRVSNLKSDSGSISTRLDNSEASGALINQDLKTTAAVTFATVDT